jgi:hypothetical protein
MEDVPNPDDYRAAGCEPAVTREAVTLLDGSCFVSGEIPRVTRHEKGLPGHVARDRDGGGEWEPDPWITDERFVALHVKGCGLVVFSASSHAGLINVLTEARRLFPDIPLYAVVGGFHLSGAVVEKIIPETVRDLADFQLRFIVPSHCTGWRARFRIDATDAKAVGAGLGPGGGTALTKVDDGAWMGLMETKTVTLRNLDTFWHIGLFSSGSITRDDVNSTTGFRDKVRLVFVSYGSRELNGGRGARGSNPAGDADALKKARINSVLYSSPNAAQKFLSRRRSLHAFAALQFRD